MGGRAERLAVARRVALDGLHLGRLFPAATGDQGDRAELILVALASLLVRGGERLTLLGTGSRR